MDAIKRMADLLDYIKTHSDSITELINGFPVSDLQSDKECADLLDYIESDLNSIEIHMESAKELIDYDKTM